MYNIFFMVPKKCLIFAKNNITMKRVKIFVSIALLCCLSFLSCKDPQADDGPTRYTLVNSLSNTEPWGGLNVYIYEYNAEDHRVDSNYISNPEYQKEYVFYPREEATHLKLRLLSNENTERWGDTIIAIKPDQDTRIRVNLRFMTNYCFNEPMLGK